MGEDETFNDESETELNYPTFGDTDSPDEVWQEFYAFFSCYATTRTYTWLDKYDTRHAENRRVSRLMEKENKKVRDTAKKERNDAVRELVKFIRKRDKRIQLYSKKLAEKREQNAKKTAEKRQKQLDAEDDDELFCVACDKEMRNEKAFASHIKQKKHLENVERLRETLLKDELISSDDLKDDSDTEAQKEETMITAEVNETKDAPSSEKLEGEEDVLKNNKSAKR